MKQNPSSTASARPETESVSKTMEFTNESYRAQLQKLSRIDESFLDGTKKAQDYISNINKGYKDILTAWKNNKGFIEALALKDPDFEVALTKFNNQYPNVLYAAPVRDNKISITLPAGQRGIDVPIDSINPKTREIEIEKAITDPVITASKGEVVTSNNAMFIVRDVSTTGSDSKYFIYGKDEILEMTAKLNELYPTQASAELGLACLIALRKNLNVAAKASALMRRLANDFITIMEAYPNSSIINVTERPEVMNRLGKLAGEISTDQAVYARKVAEKNKGALELSGEYIKSTDQYSDVPKAAFNYLRQNYQRGALGYRTGILGTHMIIGLIRLFRGATGAIGGAMQREISKLKDSLGDAAILSGTEFEKLYEHNTDYLMFCLDKYAESIGGADFNITQTQSEFLQVMKKKRSKAIIVGLFGEQRAYQGIAEIQEKLKDGKLTKNLKFNDWNPQRSDDESQLPMNPYNPENREETRKILINPGDLYKLTYDETDVLFAMIDDRNLMTRSSARRKFDEMLQNAKANVKSQLPDDLQ